MTAAVPNLRVAAIQMNSGADKNANIAAALDLIDQAAASGARFVTLPEVWPYLGPSSGERDCAEVFPGPTLGRLADRARKHGIYLHAGSMLESRPGEPRLFNTTVVFDPHGDVIAQYSKIHMFDVTLDGVGGYGSRRTSPQVTRSSPSPSTASRWGWQFATTFASPNSSASWPSAAPRRSSCQPRSR